jgi:pyruvate dehydrogenase E2 component (dihydrolipoamide acetyltransferase)
MFNVELHPHSRPAPWRKMSLTNWRHPTDPQVYARSEIDMAQALEYAARLSQSAGVTVAPLHLVIRALALCFKEYPDTNALVRRGRVYARKRINIFCHVAIPGKKPDLSGVILRDADTKDPAAIARELRDKVRAARNGTDPEFAKTKRTLDRIPSWLFRPLLGVLDLFQYTLNLNLGWLGLPQDPFGGALVTSVGSLGISEAFAPLSPITRAPIVVSVGKVEEKPVVCDGQIVARPVCVLCLTFDHRVMDGLLAAKMAKFVARYLAEPERFEKASCRPADAK